MRHILKVVAFFIILFSLLFIGLKTNAQQKQQLEVKTSFPENQILIDHIKYRKTFDSERELNKTVDQLLMQFYAQGYILARKDSVQQLAERKIVYITLNDKYEWQSLTKGNLDAIVLSDIDFNYKDFQGSSFDYNRLISIEESIIKYYENHGYPFAAIALDSIHIKDKKISAAFNLTTGPLFRIDTIILDGYNELHANYIYHLLDIKPGDVYQEQKVVKISKQLASIRFAAEAKPNHIVFAKDKATIHLDLVEQKTNIFDGIIGFQPKSSSDNKLMLTGNLRLKLINSFKRGETIDLIWRSPGNSSQNINLGFSYPYILNSPLGIDYRFKLFKQDTNFINIRNVPGIRFIINGSDYIKVSGDFFSSTTITNTLINGVPASSDVLDMRSSLFTLEANFNRLNYIFNPRKGWWIKVSGGYGKKKIIEQYEITPSFYDSIPLSTNQLKLAAHLEYFIPLFGRQTIRLVSHSALLQGDYLLKNEIFRIGGFSDFRGFDEESIYVSGYSIFTVEWRMLLERNSFINIFWNGAYTENTMTSTTTTDWPMGFGAGLSFETKAGIFALSYALGKQQGNPIEFSTAKIHFGYMARF